MYSDFDCRGRGDLRATWGCGLFEAYYRLVATDPPVPNIGLVFSDELLTENHSKILCSRAEVALNWSQGRLEKNEKSGILNFDGEPQSPCLSTRTVLYLFPLARLAEVMMWPHGHHLAKGSSRLNQFLSHSFLGHQAMLFVWGHHLVIKQGYGKSPFFTGNMIYK